MRESLANLILKICLLFTFWGFASLALFPVVSEASESNLVNQAEWRVETISVLHDATLQMSIDDVREAYKEGQFSSLETNPFNLGRSKDAVWTVFTVEMDEVEPNLFISFEQVHFEEAQFYLIQQEKVIQSYDVQASQESSYHYNCHGLCFPLDYQGGEVQVFLRLRSDAPIFYPLSIRTMDAQLKYERAWATLLSVFYGAFFVMGAFNLFVFYSTKEKHYLIYSLYVFSLMFWSMSIDGTLNEWLLKPYFPSLVTYLTHFVIALICVGLGLLFCRAFLNTREHFPWTNRLILFLTAIVALNIVVIFILQRNPMPALVNVITLSLCLISLITGIRGVRRGNKSAGYFIAAWSGAIVGAFCFVLMMQHVLPYNFFIRLSIHLGGMLETILLSLALGNKINVLQQERIEFERVTNRKLEEQNEQLERLNDDLTRSNNLKDEFLSIMSHELRTPMNGVFGATELLESTKLEPEQHRYVLTIDQSSRQMLSMIENILTYIHLESGDAQVTHLLFKARELLEEVAIQYSEMASAKNISFMFRLGANVPEFLKGDEEKFKLLLNYLLDNAVKFTDKGRVDFEINLDDDELREGKEKLGDRKLMITIRDTGRGVQKQIQEKIFSSFTQADSSLTREKQGIGIGLALSQKIIKVLNGSLDFQSTEGEGTVITLKIPFVHVGEQMVQASQEIIEGVNPAEFDVLIVEDNQVNKLVLETLLKKMGFRVISANNGKEAVVIAKQRFFHFILMDCQMPVMDGLEATRQIRKLPGPISKVPIIAITANVSPGDREQCLAAGMNDYIKKPFNKSTLMLIINYWLSREFQNVS